MTEWMLRSPLHLWPQTPSLTSPIFFAPVLTEEESVTPPCKEKIRGGNVRATVTSLYSAMSSGLRKGPVTGAGSDQDYLKGPVV